MSYSGDCVRCGIPARREYLGGPALCGWCRGDREEHVTACTSCNQILREADPAMGDLDPLNSDTPKVCFLCRKGGDLTPFRL